jgi:hypothetical protein
MKLWGSEGGKGDPVNHDTGAVVAVGAGEISAGAACGGQAPVSGEEK